MELSLTVWTELEPDIRDPDLPSMIKARGTTPAHRDEAVPHVVSNVLGIVTETEIEIEIEPETEAENGTMTVIEVPG